MLDNKFFINIPNPTPYGLHIIKNIIETAGNVFPEYQILCRKEIDPISDTELISARLDLGTFQLDFHFTTNFTQVDNYLAVFSKESKLLTIDREALDPYNRDDLVGWLSVIKDIYTQLTVISLGQPTETHKLRVKEKSKTCWVLLGKTYEIYRDAKETKIRQLFSRDPWIILLSAADCDKFSLKEDLTFKILAKEPISLGGTDFLSNSILEFSNGYTYYKESPLGFWKYVLEQDVDDLQELIAEGKVIKIE